MKEVFIILDELNKYSSLILMLATVIYVAFTYRLTKETTKLREVETTPFISLYIKPDHFLKLVIENIGKAPAYDVEFEMDEKYKKYFSCGCDFKRKISYFSPKQMLLVGMDTYHNLHKADIDNIPIKVKYRSKNNEKFEDSFLLEWRYLSGTLLESNPLQNISDELKKVAEELKKINITFETKEYFITNKLKILKFKKQDNTVKLIFSNGKIIKFSLKEFVDKINIQNIEYLHIKNGNLYDYKVEYLAEEIYNVLYNKI